VYDCQQHFEVDKRAKEKDVFRMTVTLRRNLNTFTPNSTWQWWLFLTYKKIAAMTERLNKG